MGEVVNLNQFRKKRRRADKEKKAAENRVHFGRTRAQRHLDQSETAASERDLDSKKLERDAADGATPPQDGKDAG
jgi:hypothetical protein